MSLLSQAPKLLIRNARALWSAIAIRSSSPTANRLWIVVSSGQDKASIILNFSLI